MWRVTEYRVVVSLAVSVVGGTLGLHTYPFPSDQTALGMIRVMRPALYTGFLYT